MNTNPTILNVSDYKWIRLIRDRLDSGLTVKDWCRQHGINTKTYYYHQTRLRRLAICGAVDNGLLPESLRPGQARTASGLQKPAVLAEQEAKPSPVFTPVPVSVVDSIPSGRSDSAAAARITRGSLVIEISNSASEPVLSFLKEILRNA